MSLPGSGRSKPAWSPSPLKQQGGLAGRRVRGAGPQPRPPRADRGAGEQASPARRCSKRQPPEKLQVYLRVGQRHGGPVLSTFGTVGGRIGNGRGQGHPGPSGRRGWTQSPAFPAPKPGPLRRFSRQKLRARFPAFRFSRSREVFHADAAAAFKTWSFSRLQCRGEGAGASGKTDGVPRGLPSVDASRINSEARVSQGSVLSWHWT